MASPPYGEARQPMTHPKLRANVHDSRGLKDGAASARSHQDPGVRMWIHLDPEGGIAGNMFIAAGIDAWPELAEEMVRLKTTLLPWQMPVSTRPRRLVSGCSKSYAPSWIVRSRPYATKASRRGSKSRLARTDTAPRWRRSLTLPRRPEAARAGVARKPFVPERSKAEKIGK